MAVCQVCLMCSTDLEVACQAVQALGIDAFGAWSHACSAQTRSLLLGALDLPYSSRPLTHRAASVSHWLLHSFSSGLWQGPGSATLWFCTCKHAG